MSKLIRNLTSVKQFAFVAGKQFVLDPEQELRCVDELASEFLSQNPGTVDEVAEELAPGASVQDANARKATMWLANMTGDPDLPEKIEVRVKTKDGYKLEVFDNPYAKAITIRGEMDGGMREETDSQTGLQGLNLGKIPIAIPAYSRREVPYHIGQWLLNRDANGRFVTPPAQGRLVLSRQPSNFEPDMSWELDEMRCYLRMMDDKAVLGPSEEEVIEASKGDHDYESKLLSAKVQCMRRLHFRLAHPGKRLYSKAEFEGFRRGFEKKIKPPVVEAPSQPSI